MPRLMQPVGRLRRCRRSRRPGAGTSLVPHSEPAKAHAVAVPSMAGCPRDGVEDDLAPPARQDRVRAISSPFPVSAETGKGEAHLPADASSASSALPCPIATTWRLGPAPSTRSRCISTRFCGRRVSRVAEEEQDRRSLEPESERRTAPPSAPTKRVGSGPPTAIMTGPDPSWIPRHHARRLVGESAAFFPLSPPEKKKKPARLSPSTPFIERKRSRWPR